MQSLDSRLWNAVEIHNRALAAAKLATGRPVSCFDKRAKEIELVAMGWVEAPVGTEQRWSLARKWFGDSTWSDSVDELGLLYTSAGIGMLGMHQVVVWDDGFAPATVCFYRRACPALRRFCLRLSLIHI